jgi:hypothetical protein
MSDPEPRCPSCGALVSAEAEWCGQCYEPLPRVREASPAPAASAASSPEVDDHAALPSSSLSERPAPGIVQVAGIERTDEGTVWTCPSCQRKNHIDIGTCPVCGTPFAQLFQEPEIAPDVPPSTALGLSLLLPGLGHWKLGLRGDAVARIVLFVWSFGTVLMLAVARRGTGLGSIASLFLLFAVETVAVWIESGLDAYRVASQQPPLVSTRRLMWASAAFVVVSAVVATLVALPAARGR